MADSSMKWISVKTKRPHCKRDLWSLGTPVLIWPPNPNDINSTDLHGFAFYGRRATGRPAFYLYGCEIHGVTHWMPMPKGPK